MTESTAITTPAALPPTDARSRPHAVAIGREVGSAVHPVRLPPPSTDPYERWTALAVAIGILFRVMQYLGNRSIWMDEALLIPWFQDHSFSEILDPLRVRPIPSGFLFLEKLLAGMLGDHELVLRLVPLVAGVASVFLFVAVARRCLSAGAVPIATGLFALSPFLIYYASEVKQYSSDAAVTLAILLVALVLRRRGVSASRAVLWATFTTLGLWLSLTAVFAVAGAGLMLIVAAFRERDRRSAGRVALASVPSAWLFGLPYLAGILRGPASATDAAAAQGPSYISAFWSSGFMPLPPRTLEDWLWFPHTAMRIFQDPLGLIHNNNADLGRLMAVLGIVMFAAGCVGMAYRRRFALGLLVAPILLTLLASGLHRYPFGADWNTGGRVLLFLVPVFLLLIGEGAERFRQRLPTSRGAFGIALVALLLGPPLAQAATTVPYGRGEIKPLLDYVRDHWQEGDQLYVHYDARHAFTYYAPRYGFDEGDYVEGICARFEPHRYLEALSRLRGERRVWILFTAGRGARLFNERTFMLDYLDHVGRRLDDRVARGTFVYLYDLGPGAGASTGYTARVPVLSASVEEGCALWR